MQAAKVALQNWITEVQYRARSSDGGAWAKSAAEPSARKRAAIDKEMQEEARRRSYRRIPENTEVLEVVVSYHL